MPPATSGTLTPVQDADPRTIHVRQQAAWRGQFVWTQAVDPPTDPVTYEPVDVEGYTARFRWFSKPGGDALITVVSPDGPTGGIDIDTDTATFTVHLCATHTATLSKDGNYVLDVILTSAPCEVVPIASGWANLILVGEAYPAVI